MTTQNPHSGNDTALPETKAGLRIILEGLGPFASASRPEAKTPKKSHRVSFDVDLDFLHDAQTVLSDAPKRIGHLATYMEFLRDLALSHEYDAGDPRLIAAFEIGIDAARMMEAREGQMFGQLFSLMDDDKNISRAV